MKIYQLAKDLGVEQNALFSFAQKQGIEANSVASELTSDESEHLLRAFDEAGGVLNTVSEPLEVQENTVESTDKKSSMSSVVREQVEEHREKATHFIDPKEEYKPLKKKLFSLGKKTKKKSEIPKIKIRNKFSLYQNKKISPKVVIWLVRGFILLLISIAFIFSILVLSGYKPIHEVKTIDISKSSTQSETVDFKAKLFLDNFIKFYFEYPSNKDTQKDYETKMSSFYGKEYQEDLSKRKSSHFTSSTLLSLDKEKATYLVTYETGSKKSKNLKSKTVQTTVYFEKKDSGYVIVGAPFVQNEQSIYGKQNVKRELLASDNLSEKDKKDLDKFVEGLFTAYTTNQNALENISSGLNYNSAEKFNKVSYSYYQKQDNGTYKAYIQAVFNSELGEYKQEFSFNIKQNDKTYFATDFKYNIPANYAD